MISTAKFNANLWSVSLYSSQPQSPNCLSKNQGRSTAGYTPTHLPKKNHLMTRERATRNLFEVKGQTPNSAEVELNEFTTFRIVSVLV